MFEHNNSGPFYDLPHLCTYMFMQVHSELSIETAPYGLISRRVRSALNIGFYLLPFLSISIEVRSLILQRLTDYMSDDIFITESCLSFYVQILLGRLVFFYFEFLDKICNNL